MSNLDGKCDHRYKCGSTEHCVSGCQIKNVSARANKIEILLHSEENMDQAGLFSLGVPLTGKQLQTTKLVQKRCLVHASLEGIDTVGHGLSSIESEKELGKEIPARS